MHRPDTVVRPVPKSSSFLSRVRTGVSRDQALGHDSALQRLARRLLKAAAEVAIMGWQRRIVELAAAGGILAGSTACPWNGPIFTCNANPDPCCSQPDGAVCLEVKQEEQDCVQLGGTYELGLRTCSLPDGGTLDADGGL